MTKSCPYSTELEEQSARSSRLKIVGTLGRLLVGLSVAILVGAGCASPVPTSSQASSTSIPTPSPSASPTLLQVTCDKSLAQSTCDEAVQRSIAVVKSSGWTPTQIWIESGLMCPQNALFGDDQNCPYPEPPGGYGHQWVADAEIAFAQTDEHAALNIASVGTALVPVLLGYATPPLTWCSGYCPDSVATDGDYRLELVMPRLAWKTGDPISGKADLELTTSLSKTLSDAGQLIVYSFSEVGGTRHFGPLSTLECKPVVLDPATPLGVSLYKQGAIDAAGADADFQRAFMADPDIHLPAGTWDITAIANFNDGTDCTGPSHTLKTTLRVTVTG